MESIQIAVTAKGDICFLHNDSTASLIGIGADPALSMDVTRASRVKFNRKTQLWDVWECLPGDEKRLLASGFDTYKLAVAAEIEHFENEVRKQGAEFIDRLFAMDCDGGE